MLSRAHVASILAIVLTSVALQHAQIPQNGTQFRGGVEYVEVDARVVDANGDPIRGLTERDFKVLEDGVQQQVKTFSVVDLPLPSLSSGRLEVGGLKPDVASNARANNRGRKYLIVFDAPQVSPFRTLVVRKLLRDFIQRDVDADDLVAIVSLGLDSAFENFTTDRRRLIAVVDALIGQAAPSPAVAAVNDLAARAAHVVPSDKSVAPSAPIAGAITDDARQSLRRLAQLVQAMATAGEGSKAIILVSESTPFDLTKSTESLSYLEASSLISDVQRVSTAVRVGNVPIYPVYPRGLTDGSEDGIDVSLGGVDTRAALQGEVRRQQDSLRAMADDSGGAAIVGTNDLAAGLDRVVGLSSHYYVLGYDSTNTKADGKYHRISVSVARPEARVLSRKGYNAPHHSDVKSTSLLAGPPRSSVELREALNAALPVPTLPLSITAGAFRAANGRGTSATVVLEVPGVDLALTQNQTAAVVEMTAVALAPRGVIRTGELGRVQVDASSEAMARVRRSGFRWVARLGELPPGRYQIRGAVSNGPSKQGSVWYDLEILDFTKAALAMSDVLLTSGAAAADRLLLGSGKWIVGMLPAPPTASRSFSAADSISIYAEVYDNGGRAHEIETSIAIVDDRGEQKGQSVETRRSTNGLIKIATRVRLDALPAGLYTLAVEARQTVNRAVSAGRAIPFRVER